MNKIVHMEPDLIDRRILDALQRDGSLSAADIGSRIGLSTTTCWRRIQQLDKAGVIKGRVALLKRIDEVAAPLLAAAGGVLQLWNLSGLTVLLGNGGAILAAGPLAGVLAFWSWRAVFVTLGFLALGLAALTWIGVRERIVESIPRNLRLAASVAIGLFITFIGIMALTARLCIGILILAKGMMTLTARYPVAGVGPVGFVIK